MKSPYLNACAASAYIVFIVLFITGGAPSFLEPFEQTPAIPVIMLSLLVFSVALMGYLFFYRPLELFLDGKRQEAAQFFLKTIATFALIGIGFALGVLLVSGQV